MYLASGSFLQMNVLTDNQCIPGMFRNFRFQRTLISATLLVTAKVISLRYSEILKYRWEMDSAEHFGQQAEVLWYYSAF
jgi:hypothetical protein